MHFPYFKGIPFLFSSIIILLFSCSSETKVSAPLVFDGEGKYRGKETFAEFREDATYYIYQNEIGKKMNYHTGTFSVSNDTIYLKPTEAYRLTLRNQFIISDSGIKELYARRAHFYKGDTKDLKQFKPK